MRYSIKSRPKILGCGVREMRSILSFLILLAVIGNVEALAQGGKAEPDRIKFATGRSSATLTGTLSNGQEMEYVYGVSKGQTVTIANSRASLFDFRVFNEEFDFETEFESSPTLTFTVPETGDYMLFVRKKQVRYPRTARFAITLTIK
jgi:hypothetical protein